MPTMKKPWAFSLVEVMIAVGIVAFVLSAILGLVTLAVQGTRKADTDARLAILAGRLSASYQGRSFAGALAEVATNATTYFDFDGVPTNAAGAYFRCDATNVTPAGASANLALLQMRIRWPSPQWSSSNIYVFSVANYQ